MDPPTDGKRIWCLPKGQLKRNVVKTRIHWLTLGKEFKFKLFLPLNIIYKFQFCHPIFSDLSESYLKNLVSQVTLHHIAYCPVGRQYIRAPVFADLMPENKFEN
jgi:hypothetical protein